MALNLLASSQAKYMLWVKFVPGAVLGHSPHSARTVPIDTGTRCPDSLSLSHQVPPIIKPKQDQTLREGDAGISNNQKLLTLNPKRGFVCSWKLLIYCQSPKGTCKTKSNLIPKANNSLPNTACFAYTHICILSRREKRFGNLPSSPMNKSHTDTAWTKNRLSSLQSPQHHFSGQIPRHADHSQTFVSSLFPLPIHTHDMHAVKPLGQAKRKSKWLQD